MLLNRTKIRLLQILYLLFLFIPVYLYYIHLGGFDIYGVGMLFGFWSLTLISLQPLLSSRMPLLENEVGHDRLMRWHSFNAKLTLLTVFLHPGFMFYKYILDRLTPFEIIKYYNPVGYILGYVLFFTLITIVVTSLFTRRLKINYEVWKKIHLLTYILLFGGFLHSFLIGSHVKYETGHTIWWLVLLVIASAGIIHRYIFLPRKRLMYTVDKVVKEAEGVNSIYLKPDGVKLKYLPGQFAFTHFQSKSLPNEEHHFTLSSSPTQEHLRFTIKNLGDFTSAIDKLKPGEKIQIEGSYGAFSNIWMDGPFLFISGGIGITPIMSMLQYMVDKNIQKQSYLINSTSSYKEMAFKKEIEDISQKGWLNINLLDRRIEEEDIKKALDSFSKAPYIFIVGPEGMMNSAEKILKNLGVKKDKIFTEKFALK